MIGTGVFTTTGFLVRDLGSSRAILFAWALGGFMAICGALSYAELTAALPENGGEYLLLSRIYHPALGFVAGWVSLIVGFTAPLAAAALAFGEYFAEIVPGVSPVFCALSLVVLATLLNFARVSIGGFVLSLITGLQVLLIAGFVIAGMFVSANRPDSTWFDAQAPPFLETVASPSFAVALVYIAFAYSGWNAAAYVAGELRRPERNLPLALVGGTGVVVILYVGLNDVFLHAAPKAELSGKVEVGHIAATHLFGPAAAVGLSSVVALGLVTTVVALTITGPRIYEQAGNHYPRLRGLSLRLSDRGPLTATLLQSSLALVLIATASFDALLIYIGFTLNLFAGLTVLGVFVLRFREPSLPRPYRVWGYPVTPLVPCVLMAWMTALTLYERPWASLAGCATIAVGLLLYGALRPRALSPGTRSRVEG